MKTILAAIDFSKTTEPVLRWAVQIAQKQGARLVVLHVVQPPVFIAEGTVGTDAANLTAATEQAAGRRLRHLAGELRKDCPGVETLRLTGQPVRLILEEAAKLPADLIVLGSHGHGAVYDLLVGSTAAGVLKKAHCPVTVVPAVERTAVAAE
jgi:nucleotide-binding universal stress UspA family protein